MEMNRCEKHACSPSAWRVFYLFVLLQQAFHPVNSNDLKELFSKKYPHIYDQNIQNQQPAGTTVLKNDQINQIRCESLPARIPEDDELTLIENVTLHLMCTIPEEKRDQWEAKDIFWEKVSDSAVSEIPVRIKPNSRIKIVQNDMGSSLYIANINQTDSADYKCLIPDGVPKQEKYICGINAVVGGPPKKYKNWECRSPNYDGVVCSWKSGDDYLGRRSKTRYELEYSLHIFGRYRWNKCPYPSFNADNYMNFSCAGIGNMSSKSNPNKKSNEMITFFRHSSLSVRINGTNAYGTKSWTERVDPWDIVQPHPPEVMANIADTHSVILQWKYGPLVKDNTIVYDIDMRGEFDKKDEVFAAPNDMRNIEWKMLYNQSVFHNNSAVGGKLYDVNITGLRPFTRYEFRVRGKPMVGYYSDYTIVSVQTKAKKPEVAPKEIPGAFVTSFVNVTHDLVRVFWNGLRKWDRYGADFRYNVFLLSKQSGSLKSRAFSSLFSNTTFIMPRNLRHDIVIRPINEMGSSRERLKMSMFIDASLQMTRITVLKKQRQNKKDVFDILWQWSSSADILPVKVPSKNENESEPTKRDIQPTMTAEEESIIVQNSTIYWCESVLPPPYHCSGPLKWKTFSMNKTQVATRSSQISLSLDSSKNYLFAAGVSGVSAEDEEDLGKIYSGMKWAQCIITKNTMYPKVNPPRASPSDNATVQVSWHLPCEDQISFIKGYRVTYVLCEEIFTTKHECWKASEESDMLADDAGNSTVEFTSLTNGSVWPDATMTAVRYHLDITDAEQKSVLLKNLQPKRTYVIGVETLLLSGEYSDMSEVTIVQTTLSIDSARVERTKRLIITGVVIGLVAAILILVCFCCGNRFRRWYRKEKREWQNIALPEVEYRRDSSTSSGDPNQVTIVSGNKHAKILATHDDTNYSHIYSHPVYQMTNPDASMMTENTNLNNPDYTARQFIRRISEESLNNQNDVGLEMPPNNRQRRKSSPLGNENVSYSPLPPAGADEDENEKNSSSPVPIAVITRDREVRLVHPVTPDRPSKESVVFIDSGLPKLPPGVADSRASKDNVWNWLDRAEPNADGNEDSSHRTDYFPHLSEHNNPAFSGSIDTEHFYQQRYPKNQQTCQPSTELSDSENKSSPYVIPYSKENTTFTGATQSTEIPESVLTNQPKKSSNNGYVAEPIQKLNFTSKFPTLAEHPSATDNSKRDLMTPDKTTTVCSSPVSRNDAASRIYQNEDLSDNCSDKGNQDKAELDQAELRTEIKSLKSKDSGWRSSSSGVGSEKDKGDDFFSPGTVTDDFSAAFPESDHYVVR